MWSTIISYGLPLLLNAFGGDKAGQEREQIRNYVNDYWSRMNSEMLKFLEVNRKVIEANAFKKFNERRSQITFLLFKKYFFEYILLFVFFCIVLYGILKKEKK